MAESKSEKIADKVSMKTEENDFEQNRDEAESEETDFQTCFPTEVPGFSLSPFFAHVHQMGIGGESAKQFDIFTAQGLSLWYWSIEHNIAWCKVMI